MADVRRRVTAAKLKLLAWLGRGDYSKHQWPAALAEAQLGFGADLSFRGGDVEVEV